MTLIDSARVIKAIESSWAEECADNRNAKTCATCRAYADAIRSVEWVAEVPATDDTPEDIGWPW